MSKTKAETTSRFTSLKWMVSICERERSGKLKGTTVAAPKDDTVRILRLLGCKRVKLVDAGCAAACIPTDWVAAAYSNGDAVAFFKEGRHHYSIFVQPLPVHEAMMRMVTFERS